MLNGFRNVNLCIWAYGLHFILKGAILLYNTYWPVQCRPTVESLYIVTWSRPLPLTPPKKKVIHNHEAKATGHLYWATQKAASPPIAPPRAPTYPLLSPPAIKTPRPHRRRPRGGLRGYKHLRHQLFFFGRQRKVGFKSGGEETCTSRI